MNKKFLDIKIVNPALNLCDSSGNEYTELKISPIYKYDVYYDLFKLDREISNEEFDKALDIVLAKFIQDKLSRVTVDLDIRKPHYSFINESTNKKGE